MKVLRGLYGFMIFVSLIASTAIGSNNVLAADGNDLPDYRIQLSPARMELDLEPGKVVERKFRVQNTGAKVFDFELSTGPFSVTDENYTQDLGSVTSYNNIKDWITFSIDHGTVEPDSTAEITAIIKVPNDVPAGGQYAVIYARMIEPDQDTTSGVVAEKQVGLLVYSKNIDGETREEGKVIENKVPSFMFAPPIRTSSVVENNGNVHANATYIMQVFPLFGEEEVYTNEEYPTTLTILPETCRLNTMTWDVAPQLGIFRVKQTVKFLDQESVTEKVVFICPIWFLFVILVLIFLIVFWIVSRARGRKE